MKTNNNFLFGSDDEDECKRDPPITVNGTIKEPKKVSHAKKL